MFLAVSLGGSFGDVWYQSQTPRSWPWSKGQFRQSFRRHPPPREGHLKVAARDVFLAEVEN